MHGGPEQVSGEAIITPAQFVGLLERLAEAARALTPSVDAVAGIKRSGLFPAVYLSHRLTLPVFTSTEAAHYPAERLPHLLIVDTTAWTGETLRRAIRRFERRGALVSALTIFARADPLPDVNRLNYLIASERIVRFFYEEPPSRWMAAEQGGPAGVEGT